MPAPLTSGQLALLQRIADGTEPLTIADSRFAVSVYALRSRRLVATRSQRGYWYATITDDGRKVLERSRLGGHDPDVDARAHASPTPPRDSTSIAAQDLISQLQEAGGELRLKDLSPTARAAWRRAIHAARADWALDGYRLRYSGRGDGDLVIRMVHAEAEVDHEGPPVIRVPARLGPKPHPLVAAARDVAKPGPDGWVDTMRRPGVLHVRVMRQNLNRVLRIADAIFREAGRRGHGVETSGDGRCERGVTLRIGGQRFELTLVEQTTRIPHVPTASEKARTYDWAYTPKWDHVPSGCIVLRHGHTSDGKLAGDGKRWRLEDRLGHVLAELERRAAELTAREEERIAAERRRLEKDQSDWEAAMALARRRLVEASRIDQLADHVHRWDEAAKIRTFVAAVRSTFVAPDSVEPKTEEWLTWAIDYADTIDPLNGPLFMPEPPKASPSALERFLDGWSPYGPTRSGSAAGYRRGSLL